MAAPPPVHLLKGSDPVLVDHALAALVDDLLGDADRSFALDVLTAPSYDPAGQGEADVGPLVDAAQTPPLLTDRRVVVARHAGALVAGGGATARLAPLVAYLDDPLPSTALVLVWEAAPGQAKLPTVPKALAEAVKKAGGVTVDTDPGRNARDRSGWLADKLEASTLRFDPAARVLLGEHLGEDAGRLPGILATLEGVYPPGTKVGRSEIEPFLGEAGGVAPWDLTDAIDRGDVSGALAVLARMTAGGGSHPLQVLASLHRHLQQMLRLDGLDLRDEAAAAEVLGLKSTFPARKAMQQGRKLGREKLIDQLALVAQADLDLRGARALGPDLVVEVLVARLASRSRR